MTLEPLFNADPAVQIHVAAALGAFATGLVILRRRKGDLLHRVSGYAFVTLMAVTAVSAAFITGVMALFGPEWKGWWSPIHIFIFITFVGLYKGLGAILRRDVEIHRKEMRGLFVGALLVAGALAFLPGRMMWNIIFN